MARDAKKLKIFEGVIPSPSPVDLMVNFCAPIAAPLAFSFVAPHDEQTPPLPIVRHLWQMLISVPRLDKSVPIEGLFDPVTRYSELRVPPFFGTKWAIRIERYWHVSPT